LVCTLARLLTLSFFTVILAVCTRRSGGLVALGTTAGLHAERRGEILLTGRGSKTGQRSGVGGFRGIILGLAVIFAFAGDVGLAGALDAQGTVFGL
jgi:hypothetical protein